MRLRSTLLLGLAVACPARAVSQRSTVKDVSIGAVTAVARHAFWGGELGAAVRPGAQTRAAVALAAGTEHGSAAARGQLSVQFVVAPAGRRGVGFYTGVGTVFTVRRQSAGAGYLAVLVGLEGSKGWYAEAGLGGGARAATGWRLRWF